MPTVVLLSGGSLVGQNLIQALGPRRSALRLVATSSVADEPSLADFDEVVLAPPTAADEAGLDALLSDLIDRHQPALVVPCRDDDIVFLARFGRRRPGLATRLLCGSVESAEATVDKWRSWQVAQTLGLPFADTMLPTDARVVDDFVARQGFPLVVKPRAGFASRGVSLVFERAQLDPVVGRDDLVVQVYLGRRAVLDDYLEQVRRTGLPLFHSFEDLKLAVQAQVDPAGAVCGVFATVQTMRNGISAVVEPDPLSDALELGERCARAFASIGWRGPLNLNCQRDADGTLRIYEFNGRFTGATAARALLGFDEFALALARFAAIDVGTLAAQPAVRALKQPLTRATSPDLHQRLATAGAWQRPQNRYDTPTE